MIGSSLGRYRILERIGAGGMGEVYRALDARLDRHVAVKVLLPGVLGDEAARKRFRNEALALSSLNHPNIATIHDFDNFDGIDLLVMEYIQGQTLADLLKVSTLPESEVLRLGRQLASGLAAAHSRGVVHRDLKPGNLRITSDGHLKILDFGLARSNPPVSAGDVTASLSETAPQIVGTIPYMAPETLLEGISSQRSDIYSAGIVLYEMSTGRHPFEKKSVPELIGAILHETPASPSQVMAGISSGLEQIIRKSMEREPHRRFASAGELEACLETLLTSGQPRPLKSTGLFPTRVWAWTAAFLAISGAAVLYLNMDNLFARADSIAVLPISNHKSDTELEYLSDGVTDNLISTLSDIEGLNKVIARASIVQYKDQVIDPEVVGRKLGVRLILVGRMSREEGNLVLKVELMDARKRKHIWGYELRRDLAGISNLDTDLAREISGRLRIRLTAEDRDVLERQPTLASDAYRDYLRGLYFMRKYDADSFAKALSFFKKAIDLDPAYSLAYSGLAEAYFCLSNLTMTPAEAMPLSRAAALKALAIDSTLAEPLAILGVIRAHFDWDWPGAEHLYREALERNPNLATAHQYYGFLLTTLGRTEDARLEFARARELDPLSASLQVVATWPDYFAPSGRRRHEKAVEELQRILQGDPDFFSAQVGLGLNLIALGRLDEAGKVLERARALIDIPVTRSALGLAYARAGRVSEARRILEGMGSITENTVVPPYYPAIIHVGLSEKEKAMDWLEHGFEVRDEELMRIAVDPALDDLHSHPRFAALLTRMDLSLPENH